VHDLYHVICHDVVKCHISANFRRSIQREYFWYRIYTHTVIALHHETAVVQYVNC